LTSLHGEKTKDSGGRLESTKLMACWVKQQVCKEKGAKGEKEIAINPYPLDFNGEMWVGWGQFIAWAHKGAAGERSTQAILPLSLPPPPLARESYQV
jgi:hypothetical protein